ncbi:hypothetical protein [Hymenobacter metallicola]|uniref:Uncharacterized protein n=1 Tax=Hymenobacter metallicola TaxID=2563114 RepID=A0A4Z0QH93_9BACT|nr:hypothetical protein [Hymenobacter metallicola]TGE28052.1 hypothetical protein E5K02_00890 [Hymenobacter metallicola]
MNLRSTLALGATTALLAAGLPSCGPSYYLTVKPSQPDSEWHDGRPAVSTNFDSVEVQLAYSHLRDKELMFEVEIRNGSDSAVAINPGTFYYQPVMMDRATAKKNAVKLNPNVSYVPSMVYAINPEARIQQLSARLDKEARKANGVSALEWFSIIGNVAEDLTPVKGTEKEKQAEELRREQARIDNKIYFEEQRLNHAEQADRAFNEKELWEVKMLRKNILRPGEMAHGYVVFPVFDQTLLLRISMPIGERTLIYDFDQERNKGYYAPPTPRPVAPPVPPTATVAPSEAAPSAPVR